MTTTGAIDDNDRALAGELSLRVLDAREEAEARARAERDPAFAGEVGRWDERLAGLADEIAPVQPSPAVWPRIETRIGGAANDNAVFWRRWALGATGLLAASVAALVFVVAQPDPPTVIQAPSDAATQPVRVATLTLSDDGQAAMTLVYDPDNGNLYLAPTPAMAGDTRVPHLWLVRQEGGVQLVGAIEGGAVSRHHLDAAMSGIAGQATAVAVSMEAPGHTPAADKPDGPVVASGELQRL